MTYKEVLEFLDTHNTSIAIPLEMKATISNALEIAISAIDMILSKVPADMLVEKVLPNGENYIWVLLKSPKPLKKEEINIDNRFSITFNRCPNCGQMIAPIDTLPTIYAKDK